MRDVSTPKIFYLICMNVGFGLLFLRWIMLSVDMAGFLITLGLVCTAVLRWRFPDVKWLRWSGVLDGILCVLFYPWAFVLAAFSGMYYRVYVMAVLVLATYDIYIGIIAALAGLCGLFLGNWDKEREQVFRVRDNEAGRYYELEALKDELMTATAKIERMTIVSERARIAREIHDNAGHEIVAAYMSLQTAREVLEGVVGPSNEAEDVLVLYDAALERLASGANRMREAVHNLAPVAALGVEALHETCRRYPGGNVEFVAFGNSSMVPVYAWSVLEACLNEALTNAAKHAKPRKVVVSLDITPHIVRLCVVNDGVDAPGGKPGHGLRNLRNRAAAVGGSLAVDAGSGEYFSITCVVPVHTGF